MTAIVVSPLSRIAEMAVKHKAREMVTLIAKEQTFHRPAVIAADRHLTLAMNDIAFKGTGDLIAPDDAHVLRLIEFAREWDQSAPLLIHCWMGVSRSPAAAVIAALSLYPDQDDMALALSLRAVSPYATPIPASSQSATGCSGAMAGWWRQSRRSAGGGYGWQRALRAAARQLIPPFGGTLRRPVVTKAEQQ